MIILKLHIIEDYENLQMYTILFVTTIKILYSIKYTLFYFEIC
jgi:hypothetical protein